jgi:ubiquinone/menaquinone biosynthesis C-methylase UbiE
MQGGFMSDTDNDQWLRWLTFDRYGGSPTYRAMADEHMAGYVRKGLSMISLSGAQTLLDVGCGDGLLGILANCEGNNQLQLIFTDREHMVLEEAKRHVQARGLSQYAQFACCDAQSLSVVESNSVDVVATRSVLAYVEDKPKALEAFYRVLKPGGQLLLIEPIFQDEAWSTVKLREFYESSPNSLELAFLYQWKASVFPSTTEQLQRTSYCNFNERDLWSQVKGAGFECPHMELHFDEDRYQGVDWETFVQIKAHPFTPSMKDIIEQKFTADQKSQIAIMMNDMLQSGKMSSLNRMMYLSALKVKS